MAPRKPWFKKDGNQPPLITATGGIIAAIVTVLGIITVAVYSAHSTKSPTATLSGTNVVSATVSGNNTVSGNGNIAGSFIGNNIKISQDNFQTTIYGDTNKTAFQLFINDNETECTNNSWVLLPDSGEIDIRVRNISYKTASNLTVEAIPNGGATTNIEFGTWILKGDVVNSYFFGPKRQKFSYHFPDYGYTVSQIPARTDLGFPPMFYKTNSVAPAYSTNKEDYYDSAFSISFRVYSDSSQLTSCTVLFYLQGANLPPPGTELIFGP